MFIKRFSCLKHSGPVFIIVILPASLGLDYAAPSLGLAPVLIHFFPTLFELFPDDVLLFLRKVGYVLSYG